MVGALLCVTAASVAVVDAQVVCNNGEMIANVCVPTKATSLPNTEIPTILVAIARWIVLLFGSLATIVLLVCGFQYVLSIGDDSQAEDAKKCIKWAIVGIFVAGGAYVVIKVVAGAVVGAIPKI